MVRQISIGANGHVYPSFFLLFLSHSLFLTPLYSSDRLLRFMHRLALRRKGNTVHLIVAHFLFGRKDEHQPSQGL